MEKQVYTTEEEREKCRKVIDVFAELYEIEDEDILLVDAGRYGFVKLQCYTPSYGFEELDAYTDSNSLFEELWEEWLSLNVFLLAREMQFVRDIKVSDAQQWIMKLHNDGKGYSTITSVRGVVKPAFQMAYNEDIIRRNPFDFKLVDVVPNDSQKRIAMTEEQQELWMRFIRNDKTYAKYYDEFAVLLGTGMRVSEFCGFTKSDLDFESRKIRVDHQLVRERGGKYYVEKTKTECGCRFIPMTEEVYRSLKNILVNRKKLKTEMIVDGYSSFLLLDKDDKPKVALHIENEMRWAMKKYKKLYPEKPLPHITPHVFRHTFCTNMANAGMDIKTLQYVMGHSDVGVTLNVYTHASYDRAAEQMAKILDFKEADMHGKQRKSG